MNRATVWFVPTLTIGFGMLTSVEAFAIWYHLVDVPATRVRGLQVLLNIWILAAVVVAVRIWHRRELPNLWRALARQPLTFAFVILCALSACWSIAPVTTFTRSIILTIATLLVLHVLQGRERRSWLGALVWVSAAGLVGSYLLALLLPGIGTDLNPPYSGAWRGLFWHKNHLGVVAPFWSGVFLAYIAATWNTATPHVRALAAGLYGLSLVLVGRAESATGYILAVLVNLSLVGLLIWLKIRPRLRRMHYWGFLGMTALALALAAANSRSIVSLLGKSPSLTGRVPLWNHLLAGPISERPWFGHGFGALWSTDEFRIGLQDSLGWGYPVRIADNGAIDILLDLGLVGLLLFMAIFIQAAIAAVRYGRAEMTVMGFFPCVFLIYWAAANLAFSLILQTELSSWCTLVGLLAITSGSDPP